MRVGKVAPAASEFSAWINLRMSSLENRVAESWARGPGNSCSSTLTNKGWTRAVVTDRLKAPASNMSQGSVRLSGTTQTMPARVTNSLANRVLRRVPPCMSSDETQGFTKGSTAGSQSLRLRAIRWLSSPDQLMNTFIYATILPVTARERQVIEGRTDTRDTNSTSSSQDAT